MPKHTDAAPEAGKNRPAETKNGTGELRQAVSRDQVIAYLRRHREFFRENPELLDSLDAPQREQGKGVVDFQHAMVQRLRSEVHELISLRNDLLSVGRANMTSQDRVHRAVLAVLEATSFEQFIERVTTDLAVILDLDLVSLAVERAVDSCPRHPVPGIFCLERGAIAEIFGPQGRTLLRATESGDPAIYGAGAGLVGSEALLRLDIGGEAPDALLALASRKEDKFDENNGTELLNFLARVLEICFRGWLDLATT